MIPQKLKTNDEIRVVAPAASLATLTKENIISAKQRLSSLGFNVSFSRNSKEKDIFISSSIESRIKDMHDAFKDKNVKALLCARGGFNSNQLLRFLDYNLIKKNPKILCGYSDITAISNAIFAKTGLVTYSGPNFSTFAASLQYVEEYFRKCLIEDKPFSVVSSAKWMNDRNDKRMIKNNGWYSIHPGKAEGIIVGGNMSTMGLLQGTEFMPSLDGSILFLEDDDQSGSITPLDFDRNLQSLIHLDDFDGVKGIVVGRFQKESQMTRRKLVDIINSKKELRRIPVVGDADFGHTLPLITFPIGGKTRISALNKKISIEITNH